MSISNHIELPFHARETRRTARETRKHIMQQVKMGIKWSLGICFLSWHVQNGV